jgi:hypothetical protein
LERITRIIPVEAAGAGEEEDDEAENAAED